MGNPEDLGLRLPGSRRFSLASIAVRPTSQTAQLVALVTRSVSQGKKISRRFAPSLACNCCARLTSAHFNHVRGRFLRCLAGARVFGFEFSLFGCLTFEVTCTRQRDPMDQRSIMSIARFAGPAGRAVARQVHRRVRQTCEVNKCGNHVLNIAIARRPLGGGQP
jgi:hypothetical protein